MPRGSQQSLYLLVVTLTGIVLFVTSLGIPQNAWDLLGHVGSMFALSETDPQVIHSLSYQAVHEALAHNPAALEDLMTGNETRVVWGTDPIAFRENLPFYQPRILITGPMWLATQLGMSPVTFLGLYTSITVAIGIYILALAFKPWLTWLSILCFPVLILLGGTLEAARMEGADALVFLLFSLLVYGLVHRKLWLLIPLILMQLGRSDTILLTACFTPLIVLQFWPHRLWVVLAVFAAVAAYLGTNHHFGNYGWAKQVYVAHEQYLAFPGTTDVVVTAKMYFKWFFQGLLMMVYDKTLLLFIVATFFTIPKALWLVKSTFNELRAMRVVPLNGITLLCAIALCNAAYVFLHYVAFPTIHIRYFSGQYTVQLLVILALFTHQRSENERQT